MNSQENCADLKEKWRGGGMMRERRRAQKSSEEFRRCVDLKGRWEEMSWGNLTSAFRRLEVNWDKARRTRMVQKGWGKSLEKQGWGEDGRLEETGYSTRNDKRPQEVTKSSMRAVWKLLHPWNADLEPKNACLGHHVAHCKQHVWGIVYMFHGICDV